MATVDLLIPIALVWQIQTVTPLQIRRQRYAFSFLPCKSLLIERRVRTWRDNVMNVISSGGVGAVMSIILTGLYWTRPDSESFSSLVKYLAHNF